MNWPGTFVLGTLNEKKCLELAQLLEPRGFQVLSLAQFPHHVQVEETGTTFAENARLKATQQALALSAWVIADDSGLEVDALQGRPGVYSARYSGADATDASNNTRLLAELEGIPLAQRSARYVCNLALSDPQGTIQFQCEDYCRGRILPVAVGTYGFGYDPLFEVVEYHHTFGALGPAVKACISHRARALRALLRMLERGKPG